MIRKYKNTVLPNQMLEDLAGISKGVKYRNCLRILEKVTLADHKKDYQNNYDFTPVPQNWFKTVIGGRYNEPLNVLLENHIIERTDTFGVGQCFEYRINPNYIAQDMELTKTKFYYNVKEDSPYYVNAQKEIQPFISNFDRLHIPFEKMYKAIDEKVGSICLNDYSHDEAIDWPYRMKVHELSENWLFTPLYDGKRLTKKEAINVADQREKVLVDNGKKIIMVDEAYFLAEQKQFTEMAWTSAVDNLSSHETLYAHRNKTNNRLDTNFTNLPKKLWETILYENGMGEADVVSCQPTLLGHVLKNEKVGGSDTKKFIELVQSGKYYEWWGGEEERDRVKKMMFQMLFGKRTHPEFKKAFPSVAQYIQDYKKQNGYKAFSNMLQRLEAKIFIDGIYYSLLAQGVPCFTKHDSIAFWADDRCKVQDTMYRVFKQHGLKAIIKTEFPT